MPKSIELKTGDITRLLKRLAEMHVLLNKDKTLPLITDEATLTARQKKHGAKEGDVDMDFMQSVVGISRALQAIEKPKTLKKSNSSDIDVAIKKLFLTAIRNDSDNKGSFGDVNFFESGVTAIPYYPAHGITYLPGGAHFIGYSNKLFKHQGWMKNTDALSACIMYLTYICAFLDAERSSGVEVIQLARADSRFEYWFNQVVSYFTKKG